MVGLCLIRASWGCWPDVLIDFGRELYVPWQLTEGKVLYTDIAHLSGPLSPYINAVWFRLFGVSLLTLVLCNIVLLAVQVGLSYVLLCQAAGRFAATCACLTFLAVFAFGQLISVGNYNFVCPYAHEVTHGLLLGTAAIACTWAYHRTGRLPWLVGAGAAVGLLFLTKAEMFLAGAAAVAAGAGFTLWTQRPSRRATVHLLVVLFVSAVLPPAVALGLLGLVMPTSQALRATIGAWVPLGAEGLVSLDFYRRGMGLLDPAAQFMSIGHWMAGYAAMFLPIGVLSLILRRPGIHRTVIAVLVSIGVVVALVWNMHNIEWRRLALPWPVFLAAIATIALLRVVSGFSDDKERSQQVLVGTLSVFSLVLLPKMILNTRMHHYGFALAMPGTLLIVVAMVEWIPAYLSRRGGCGWVFRGAALAALAVAAFVHLQRSYDMYAAKTVQMAGGADGFQADARGDAVNTILDEIERVVPREATLAVFPEGVMINYLGRRANPTPHINFMPPELAAFGESHMLDALKAHPPNYVVVVHKDTSEYGPRFFGQDYGLLLSEWIDGNYRPISLAGDRPLRSEQFGILLMERSSP